MFAQIIHGDAIFTDLAGEWDELASRGMTDTPFQKLAYQQAWWTNLQPQESELESIIVRNGDGSLAAIACLYLTSDGTVRFNGCVEETDYLDLISTAEVACESWSLVVSTLLGADYPDWHYLELCNIPEASPSLTFMPQIASELGLTVVESINEVCPVITLPGSFEEYLAGINSKQRREVRRKIRRAEGAETRLHVVDQDDDLASAVDDFLELLQKSTFEKRDWLNDGRRALFHETADAAQKAGTLQLMFIGIADQKAAALFNFDYADRIWVYNSGLDPEAFAALSPGVVITARAIELAIANGRDEFDFLRGDEDYKYRFGAKDTFVYRLQITR